MEITKEMLDIIEEVKGKRNPALWDIRCQQRLENKSNISKSVIKSPVKTETTS